MINFFKPLFSESTKSYRYKGSVDEVRLKIETVLEKSRQGFSDFDIEGRFIGGNTFQIESPVPAATNGIVYRSTLYGFIKPDNEGGTKVIIRTQSAISLRLLFWFSIAIGAGYIIRHLTIDTDQTIWSGIAILALGPFLAARIADVNNGVIEDRYFRYMHKKVAA